MKNVFITFVLVSCIGVSTSALAVGGVKKNGIGINPYCPVFAQKGMQNKPSTMPRNMPRNAPVIDPETLAKIKKFSQENAGLYKNLAMKRVERDAIMKGTSPDASRAAALTGEMFDLRFTLQQRADEAGIGEFIRYCRTNGFFMGPHRYYGKGNKGSQRGGGGIRQGM